MVRNLSIGIFLSLAALAANPAKAQHDTVTHHRVMVEGEVPGWAKPYDGKTFKPRHYQELIQSIEADAYRKGYLALRLNTDTVNDTLVVKVLPGEKYSWAQLRVNSETAGVMREAGVNIERFQQKPVSPQRIANLMETGLKWTENNGFPFASFRLDSLEFEGQGVRCALVLEKGPPVRIDSVIVNGTLQVRKTYLCNYLGIREGDLYSEKAIRDISPRLSDVQFLREFKPAEVRFNKAQTKVYLYLNTQRASRFDGIIGFLPDEETGRILITGDVTLHLENALKQGEIIDLNWRKLQTNTQDLNFEAVAPFVLNSPITPDVHLKIYRRDTLFTDVFAQLGLRYIFSRNNYLRVFADRQSTNLNSTSDYENTLIIPPYLDRSIISYGLGASFTRLDYRLNPSRGIEASAEGAAGNKTIIENPNLPAFIYDSLNLKSLQVKSAANIAYYLPVVPRLVWHQRFLGAMLVNEQLFNNEAYRVGGLKTLRGFNEESIFATAYAIARSELRYQIEKNGYVFLLFDGAWYENRSLNRVGAGRDTPYGFGAGITFGTRAGIFSLSYALGSEQGNPVLLRAAKIHFGFLSVF